MLSFKGNDIVVKGNTINNGSTGIYFSGFSTAIRTSRIAIDSNNKWQLSVWYL
jgi:hypothetical protein